MNTQPQPTIETIIWDDPNYPGVKVTETERTAFHNGTKIKTFKFWIGQRVVATSTVYPGRPWKLTPKSFMKGRLKSRIKRNERELKRLLALQIENQAFKDLYAMMFGDIDAKPRRKPKN